MIPRFKPAIGLRDLAAAFQHQPDAVARFEQAFAHRFGATDGIAFSYGRGALFTLCKVLGLEGAEIIVPAYTCSVVAHAVAVSGNTCRFVDSERGSYNMDLAQLEAMISERTRMVIATHIFGVPADVDRLQASVARASARWGHKIWLVQDCAHGFGMRWQGQLVSQAGDVALFGLGISKMMTSIFGGMLATNDADLAARLRAARDAATPPASAMTALSQQVYLVASTAAFSAPFYWFVRWLQDETPLLDGLTKAYHLDGQIRLPPGAADRMTSVEAQVGLSQLQRYDAFERERQAHARFYREHLAPPPDWVMPPAVDGATYSHFPIRVPDRDATLRHFLAHGIQLGQLIEYSVPHLAEYGTAPAAQFPNAFDSSHHTINLPVHPGLSVAARDRVVACVNDLAKTVPVAAAMSA